MQLISRIVPRIGILLLCASLFQPAAAESVRAQTSCGLAQPALCETFDEPSANGAGTRAGNLDGVLWGVSRATNNDNPSQGQLYRWAAATRSTCGSSQTVAAEQDVAICNGQLVETVNDDGQDTILAAYPRQPFDIAGRTGIATFDVNDDTQGPHAAWPAFVYTDQPVPAPYGQAAGLADTPRNSFGVSFATPECGGDTSLTGVDSMSTTTNYQLAEQSFSSVGCIQRASNTSLLNHFEIHLKQSGVEVWGTDPGSRSLKELAVGNFGLPLSRGLIWIEDLHYNACKFNSQCNHTFVWDNVGFDGPVLPRDLGFDVLDATHTGTSGGDLGFLIPTAGSLTLQIPNVTSLEKASAALLEFTFWPHTADSLTYAVNGHPAHVQAWPFGPNATYVSQTIGVPVPVGELQDGTNSVVLTSSDTTNGGLSIANIDLILVAAGDTVSASGGSPSPGETPSSTSSTASGSGAASAPPPSGGSSGAGESSTSPQAAPPAEAMPVVCRQTESPAAQLAQLGAPGVGVDAASMTAPLAWRVLASIDPAVGGSLVSADGVFTLQVPAAAAGCTLNVSLAPDDPLTPAMNLKIGEHAYRLIVTNSLGKPVSSFDTPLVLTILAPAEVDPGTLQVLALDAATGALVPLQPLPNDDGSLVVLLPALATP